MSTSHATYIDRLPPELIQRIFLTHLLTYASKSKLELQTTLVSVSLSSVNSYWRGIALNTPELWTHISTCNIQWAHVQIRRSGSLPLHINIGRDVGYDRHRHSEECICASWMPVLDVLINHSERWVRFILHRQIPLHDAILQHFRPIVNHIPCLENLRILRSDDDELDDPWDMFVNAPSLRHVEWFGYRTRHPLPYEGLRYLNITYTFIEEIISVILPSLTNIITLIISRPLAGDPAEFIISTTRVTLPTLHFLQLEGKCQFLDVVSLPSLRCLNVHVGANKLPTLLKHSQCQETLRELTLKIPAIKDTDLISILSLAPRLHKLTIASTACTALTPHAFKTLTLLSHHTVSDDGKQSSICPKLETFIVRSYTPYCYDVEYPSPFPTPWEFSISDFLDMVESRKRLKRISFSGTQSSYSDYYTGTPLDVTSHERLKRLRRKGCNIAYKIVGRDFADPSSDLMTLWNEVVEAAQAHHASLVRIKEIAESTAEEY